MNPTFWWHEQPDGSLAGPFTEDDIRRFLADGLLVPHARIWSSRQEPWPPTAAAAAGRRLKLERRLFGWAGLMALALLGWALFGLIVAMIASRGELFPDTVEHPWRWFGAGLLLAGNAFALGALWWFLPASLGAGGELQAGLRVVAVLTGAAWLLPVAIVFRDTPVAVRQAQVLHGWGALMSAGPDPNTLVVQGSIGPGFGQRLSQRLAALPDPARIIIESPGGLVDEALTAAQAIERRRATVVVGDGCASACIIVLMAGQRRIAPYDGSILFHATAPVVSSSNALANWLAGQEGDRTRAYLLSRGVPATDLDEARRRGPSDMFAVPDVTALRQGVLTGLYDDQGDLDRDALLRLGVTPAR